ncbi:hypothetical protein M6B38_232645 [Iris pallida]|uniref:Uncharacterized protein n=1 Tax=Iris pallida TaxID=29817 RepID=A0AAX6DS29_IRIPA|nr:hypothetical protein M6B38_232645 [Iris pallida]
MFTKNHHLHCQKSDPVSPGARRQYYITGDVASIPDVTTTTTKRPESRSEVLKVTGGIVGVHSLLISTTGATATLDPLPS